ncbi:hypothetical protein [Geodermatophilus sp. SYSU D01036]
MDDPRGKEPRGRKLGEESSASSSGAGRVAAAGAQPSSNPGAVTPMLGITSGPPSPGPSPALPRRASADVVSAPTAPATGGPETAANAAAIPSAHALAPSPGINRADRTPRRFLSMDASP